jgi:dimethylargininase
MTMLKAFTRAVSPQLAECELTHLERVAIDPARAAAQHATYEAALRDCGFEVIRLPELPDHPDAVFVEDTALILGDHAIITRPGAPSRIGEIGSTAEGLAPHFTVHRVAHGHVDGGDVLRIGRTLYVGRSTRTDRDGIASLGALVAPLGYKVCEASLGDCLHLKTGATLAGDNLLVYLEGAVDPHQFEGVESLAVDPAEPSAANLVTANGRIVMPAGNPRTAAVLRQRGLDVIEVDVSELQKAESGVTCMSLLDERP